MPTLWVHMPANTSIRAYGIPPTIAFKETLRTSLIGHTANCVSGRWTCSLSGKYARALIEVHLTDFGMVSASG